MFYKDSQNIYRVEPLEGFDWLVHGFGTRWSNSFGSCRNLATLHQIHSDIVIDAGGRSGSLGDGDALVENTPGHLVAVKTADCIPILIVDPRQRAVAAVHAGWRGNPIQDLQLEAIEQMQRRFASQPGDLLAAIESAGIGKMFAAKWAPKSPVSFWNSSIRIAMSTCRQPIDTRLPVVAFLWATFTQPISAPCAMVSSIRSGGTNNRQDGCYRSRGFDNRRNTKGARTLAPLNSSELITRRLPGIRPASRPLRFRDGPPTPGTGCRTAPMAPL